MADLDIDIESIDDKPSRVPARPSRFMPKGSSKLKQPKPEPGVSSSAVSARVENPVGGSNSDDVAAPMDVDEEAKPEAFPQDESMEAFTKEDVSMEEDGEEDTVVREIDVYFTRPSDPNSKLCVLQYPLRPYWRPYDLEERCKEVRLKFGKSEVKSEVKAEGKPEVKSEAKAEVKAEGTAISGIEVDLEVDRDANNYDMRVERALRIKKQTLESKWMLPKSTTYAVGVLVGNKLHINPIDAVFQLRPSMKHVVFDQPDCGDSSDEDADKKSGGSSKKQVPSKSNAPSNEQNKDTAVTWLPLEYHGKNSFARAECLRDMVRQEDSPPLQFSMSRSDYVNSLCSIAPNGDKGSKGLWERVSPTVKGPWQECLKEWLVEGPPIHRFATLRHIAPDVSEEEFIVELRKHAVLVRGLWVPRTGLLYKGADASKQVARDYILGLFTDNEVIENSRLPTKPQLRQIIRDELGILAFERSLLGDWKFKEQTDSNFIKEHEKLNAEEMEAWKKVKERAAAMVGDKHQPVTKTSSKPATPNNPLESSSKQTSKISTGVETRMPMPDETREALTHALQKLFNTLKVCSANHIHQRLREMALSESFKPKGSKEALNAALGGDNSSKELQAVISEVCVNIHGVYVPRSSPDHPEFDDFRRVVIDLFLADVPNAKIRKAAIREAAKVRLKRDIKDPEFFKVLQDMCVSQSGAWVLKSGDGSSSSRP